MSIETSGLSSTAGTAIAITWVLMVIHVEEATDKRTTWRPWKFTSVEEMHNPCSTEATDVSRQDVRRTWEVL
jgi:hypothetical protein